MNVAPISGLRCQTTIRRSASTNGSGRSSTASTTLKTAVLAPIAIARTVVATMKRSGSRRADLNAYRRSWTISLMYSHLADKRGSLGGGSLAAGAGLPLQDECFARHEGPARRVIHHFQ